MSPFDRRSSSETYFPSLAKRLRSALAMTIRSFRTPTTSIVVFGEPPPGATDCACFVYKKAPMPTTISSPMNPSARPIDISSSKKYLDSNSCDQLVVDHRSFLHAPWPAEALQHKLYRLLLRSKATFELS